MKRTHWILAGLIGTLSFGLPAFGNDLVSENPSNYTLDGTLEPDAIPGFRTHGNVESDAVDSPDAPVRRSAVTVPSPVETALSRPRPVQDVALAPPRQVRADEPLAEYSDKYALVQWNRRAAEPAKPESTFAVGESFSENNQRTEAEQREVLRKSIRQILHANVRRAITTQHNSPGDVLLMALPYGADAKVYQPNPAAANSKDKSTPRGSYIYSIGTLCWNYPCSGKTLLRTDGKRVFARIGAGYQRRPASFLALLAMSNIMPDYELKVDGNAFTIEHLVATEKAGVSKGLNHSMALVGLSFYGDPSEKWKNEMGEEWTIERMVVEELNRSIDQGTSDVTDWLLGLTAAVKLYEEEGKPIRGAMALAHRQIRTYQEFVLSVQNDQYLWHPKFFLYRGTSPDTYETLYSSGHILRWLLLSLSDKELESPKVRRAVTGLATAVNRVPTNVTAGTLNDRQLEGLAVSLQALAIYSDRVFGDEPEAEQQSEEKTASQATAQHRHR